ncbi:hypothetical protein FPQ18DRAFT_56848 [Pyronema domesticum]|nr:hypothetical protein FPQ18DRAFT_56848 [Pyronema domesticum]
MCIPIYSTALICFVFSAYFINHCVPTIIIAITIKNAIIPNMIFCLLYLRFFSSGDLFASRSRRARRRSMSRIKRAFSRGDRGGGRPLSRSHWAWTEAPLTVLMNSGKGLSGGGHNPHMVVDCVGFLTLCEDVTLGLQVSWSLSGCMVGKGIAPSGVDLSFPGFLTASSKSIGKEKVDAGWGRCSR